MKMLRHLQRPGRQESLPGEDQKALKPMERKAFLFFHPLQLLEVLYSRLHQKYPGTFSFQYFENLPAQEEFLDIEQKQDRQFVKMKLKLKRTQILSSYSSFKEK